MGVEDALRESVEDFPNIRQADIAWVCSGALVLGCQGVLGWGAFGGETFPWGDDGGRGSRAISCMYITGCCIITCPIPTKGPLLSALDITSWPMITGLCLTGVAHYRDTNSLHHELTDFHYICQTS